MSKYYEMYGMEQLSLDETIALPETQRNTRNNKYEIITLCDQMRRMIDQIESRAKGAPVLDNQKHSDVVKKYRDMVKRAAIAVESASVFGEH